MRPPFKWSQKAVGLLLQVGCVTWATDVWMKMSSCNPDDLLCIYIYIYIYIHTHTHTHTHMHMHTHTCSKAQLLMKQIFLPKHSIQ